MKINSVIQTKMYARKGYPGRKVKVLNIQEDIEPGKFSITGVIILKDKTITKQIVVINSDKL